MPKMKTHSGAKKRVRLTGTGKLMRGKPYKSHLLERKSQKRKRNYKKETEVAKCDQKVLKKNLGLK
ncbi:MAG: 50S ribosomal protein L35 [Coriobacteriales bacterium]|nr:50S ribosomal protein L35 [Coriobacteriales bacterium]